jgi:alkyl hydroperoxide reductase subunit AhpC
VLVQATLNDAPVGRSVDETLRLVQAFQYVDEHGEVCPVNWTVPSPPSPSCCFLPLTAPRGGGVCVRACVQPGSATMKADPKESLAYFEKVNQ